MADGFAFLDRLLRYERRFGLAAGATELMPFQLRPLGKVKPLAAEFKE
jgi:hypothetical protein